MFKAMILLKRKDGMSRDDFRSWWYYNHAQIARKLPGLRRLSFNMIRGDDDSDFDGVSELWFDTRDCFDAAYASDIGKQVAADSLGHVSKRERMFVEEHIVFPRD